MDIGALIDSKPGTKTIPDTDGQIFIPGAVAPKAEFIDPDLISDSVVLSGNIPRKQKPKSKFIVQKLETIKRMGADGEWHDEQAYIDMDDLEYSKDTGDAVKVITRHCESTGLVGAFRVAGVSRIVDVKPNPQPQVVAVERNP